MSDVPSARAMVRPFEDAARHVAPWIAHLARVGYVADAVLYATIGILAAEAALRHGGETTDAGGALHAILHAPMGDVLLLVCGIGFAGYALWRVVDAITDAEGLGRDAKGIAGRITGAVLGVVYGALAILAFRLGTGSVGGDDGGSGRLATRLFALPAGQWLTWIVALVLVGYGLFQIYCALTSRLDRQLDLAGLRAAGRGVIPVCRVGIAARGIVFGMVGVLLIRAVADRDPGSAGGIRESLNALGHTGHWLLALVALGLVAYAVYELLNARYRRIP